MPSLASTRHTPLHLALVVLGFSFSCNDSLEPADSMRVNAEVDGGSPAQTSNACVGDACAEDMLSDRWLCPVGDVSVLSATVRYSFQVIDFVSRMPKKDVTVKACRNNDALCEEPVATFVDTRQTGLVQLMLPTGFLGFLEVTSDKVDTLLYITNPIVRNTRDRDLSMPTQDSIGLFALLLDYPWDMEKGIVVLEVLDCSETPQDGIHFESHDGGDPFYIVEGVPIKAAQTTVFDSITGTAEGGFINVPAGNAQFTAKLGTDPDAMVLGTFNAQIRPRTMSIIALRP
jgi:hypothetical protein